MTWKQLIYVQEVLEIGSYPVLLRMAKKSNPCRPGSVLPAFSFFHMGTTFAIFQVIECYSIRDRFHEDLCWSSCYFVCEFTHYFRLKLSRSPMFLAGRVQIFLSPLAWSFLYSCCPCHVVCHQNSQLPLHPG